MFQWIVYTKAILIANVKTSSVEIGQKLDETIYGYWSKLQASLQFKFPFF